MANILVIHGPNLNLLGKREPGLYGDIELTSINERLANLASSMGHNIISFQSNHEGELIDAIQQKMASCKAMILNPAGLTHTSIALRDAVIASELPFIEVHLTNIFQREPFRRMSYFSDRAIGVITGLGENSYHLALHGIDHYLNH